MQLTMNLSFGYQIEKINSIGRRYYVSETSQSEKTRERLLRFIIKHAGFICQKCGVEEGLQLHHKNGHHYDNHIDNLQLLCFKCHAASHKMKVGALKYAILKKEKWI